MIKTCMQVPVQIMLQCPECQSDSVLQNFKNPTHILKSSALHSYHTYDYTIAICPVCNNFVIIDCKEVK